MWGWDTEKPEGYLVKVSLKLCKVHPKLSNRVIQLFSRVVRVFIRLLTHLLFFDVSKFELPEFAACHVVSLPYRRK